MFKNAIDYDMKLSGKYSKSHRKEIITPLGRFKGLKAAQQAHGLPFDRYVSRRCRSTNPKWAEWYYAESGPNVDPDVLYRYQNGMCDALGRDQESITKKRKATMLKYGISYDRKKLKYTYDGMSLQAFMRANKKLVIELIDHTKWERSLRFRKIHELLESNCDGKIHSQHFRNDVIGKFVKKEEEA